MPPFGNNLSRLRKKRRLSQAQLAAAIGLSASSKGYISELESGKKRPSTELLLKLADYFSVSTDDLLGRTSPAGGKQPDDDD